MPALHKRRVWLAAGGALGLGVAAAAWHFRLRPAADLAVSTLLAQSYPLANGQPLALEQFRSKPLVLNFWATWCAPCVEEMPELSAIATAVAAKGVNVLGIGVDSASNIAQFSQKLPVSYPLIVVGGAGLELVKQFGNLAGGLPFTALINSQGQIQSRILGRFNRQALESAAFALR
jgi:thiol-disulfide isomerase/thioredoxin